MEAASVRTAHLTGDSAARLAGIENPAVSRMRTEAAPHLWRLFTMMFNLELLAQRAWTQR